MRGFGWIIGAVVAVGCASTVASATAVAAPAPAVSSGCAVSSQTIAITGLAFQPPAVAPGQTSQAILSAVNCTGVSQQASAEWLGRFVGTAPGIPAGCPAIDPLLQQMNFPPHGQLTGTVGYLVPGSCTASGLVVTVEILQNGKVVAQRSAELTIVRPTQARDS